MEYKRLTTKGSNYYDDEKVTCAEEIYEQLKDIEDKIENGTLIELPCKVGDTVYSIPFNDDKKIFKHKVKHLRLLFISEAKDCNFIENNFAWFGENIFLTKAEAEKKIKELKEV